MGAAFLHPVLSTRPDVFAAFQAFVHFKVPRDAVTVYKAHEAMWYHLSFEPWQFSDLVRAFLSGKAVKLQYHKQLIGQRQNLSKSVQWMIAHNVPMEFSCVSIGRFVVVCDNPYFMVWLVNKLRMAGFSIPYCQQEQAKFDALPRGLKVVESETVTPCLIDPDKLYDSFAGRPYEFEKFCTEAFRRNGYPAFRTKSTGDGGFDVCVKNYKNAALTLVECKCWAKSHKVSRPAVQKLIGAGVENKAGKLIFITTSDYTNEAKDSAQKVHMELWNSRELAEFFSHPNGMTVVKKTETTVPSMEAGYLTLQDVSLSCVDEDALHLWQEAKRWWSV